MSSLGDFALFDGGLRKYIFKKFPGEVLIRLSIASKSLNTYIYKDIQPCLDKIVRKQYYKLTSDYNYRYSPFALASYYPKPYRLIIRCLKCNGWIFSGIWRAEHQPSGGKFVRQSQAPIERKKFCSGISLCHKCLEKQDPNEYFKNIKYI